MFSEKKYRKSLMHVETYALEQIIELSQWPRCNQPN
jgi:hypothetical protein